MHAQAVAQLAFTLGGGELTYMSAARLTEGYRQEQQEVAAQRLDGLTQEREREHDWLIRPRRARHRDSRDSGRDR